MKESAINAMMDTFLITQLENALLQQMLSRIAEIILQMLHVKFACKVIIRKMDCVSKFLTTLKIAKYTLKMINASPVNFPTNCLQISLNALRKI